MADDLRWHQQPMGANHFWWQFGAARLIDPIPGSGSNDDPRRSQSKDLNSINCGVIFFTVIGKIPNRGQYARTGNLDEPYATASWDLLNLSLSALGWL
jgi:hypothetical protein